jgi:hypothetical protein
MKGEASIYYFTGINFKFLEDALVLSFSFNSSYSILCFSLSVAESKIAKKNE